MTADATILIVDDSALVRQVLKRDLEARPGVTVIATAPDPFIAREKIKKHAPDLVVLDLEMPRMDGLTFLRKLMKYDPRSVVICSSMTPRGCDLAMQCLEAGALEVVCKPGGSFSITDLGAQIADLARNAARRGRLACRPSVLTTTAPTFTPTSSRRSLGDSSDRIIAIGASTGGTEAIRTVLSTMPADSPPILMVQHMPPGFTKAFSERLDKLSAVTVKEAEDGDELRPGLALLAPGDRHLSITRSPGGWRARVQDGPRVKRHKPSVEVLFESVAAQRGADTIAALLTGMGDDGADGLLAIREAGGTTIAQDEASCVVFGMPKVGIARGGAMHVLPLDDIGPAITKLATGRAVAA
jgi:two-component system chemotaxis response regulator CheB